MPHKARPLRTFWIYSDTSGVLLRWWTLAQTQTHQLVASTAMISVHHNRVTTSAEEEGVKQPQWFNTQAGSHSGDHRNGNKVKRQNAADTKKPREFLQCFLQVAVLTHETQSTGPTAHLIGCCASEPSLSVPGCTFPSSDPAPPPESHSQSRLGPERRF